MTGKDIFDNYKDLQTERSVLEIQIKNFMGVTDADIIASMCFGHPDDSADRVQTSGTSDKTASVAMKYHEVAIRENQEWYEWLLNKYLELDAELCFFDGCVDALGSKRAPIIRDLLDGESTWDDIVYTHHVGRATISRYRKEAVEEIDRRIRQVEQYFIEGDHEAIIPKDEWLAVQMEIERREAYRQEVMTQTYGKAVSPFSNHLVCSKCGKVYGRCSWSRNGIYFWRCQGKRDGAEGCNGEAVFEEKIYNAFRIAWNSTCKKKGEYKERWDAMIKEGNPLERLRAKQMIELTKEGPVDCNVPELIRMVLERMIVISKTEFEVRFLDGTVQKVCVGEE